MTSLAPLETTVTWPSAAARPELVSSCVRHEAEDPQNVWGGSFRAHSQSSNNFQIICLGSVIMQYAIINEPSLVQVTQLHAVWSDQGSGVAPEGVGLVDQVPEPVTVYDHGDVEGHDLLEDKGDAAQHGLVLAKAWANNHAVHPGKPGVHLETSGGLDFNFNIVLRTDYFIGAELRQKAIASIKIFNFQSLVKLVFIDHLLHPVLLVQDGVYDQLRSVAPDHGGGGCVTEQVDTVHTRLER